MLGMDIPFYASSLNMKNVYKLEIGEDPRTYSDFLFEISEQEYNAYCFTKGPPKMGSWMFNNLRKL